MPHKLTEEEITRRDKEAGVTRLGEYIDINTKCEYECNFCKKPCNQTPYKMWHGAIGHATCGRRVISRDKSVLYKGFKEISGTYWSDVQHGAKLRNIPFSLSIEEAHEKLIMQNWKCFYSGIELYLPNYQSDPNERTASIDRLNSSVGYTKNNIVWCHKTVNQMKWDLTVDELKHWCELIYKHGPSN